MLFFSINYGEIDFVGLHTENTHRIAFVVFRDANDARKAAIFTGHVIAGHVVNVRSPDIIAQPPNLLNMPDDCVKDIMRYLDMNDLCSVAGVCQRFNALAKAVFNPKWKDLRFTVNSVGELQEFLSTFGSEVHTIRLEPSVQLPKSQFNSVVSVLVKHCSGTLTRLEMSNFAFETNCDIIDESRSLLVGLKKLILHKCAISVKWFIECIELVDLELFDTHVTYNGAQWQKCPKLETLKIIGSKLWVENGLRLFLEQNAQLKTLDILPMQTANRAYGTILYHVPKTIENLTVVPAEMTCFGHLSSLKKLRLESAYQNSYARSLINRLNNPTIEQLEIDLNHFMLDELNAESIGKLRQINTLKIHCSGGFTSSLRYMLHGLCHLSDLVLSTVRNQLSANDIHAILQQGPNLQRLYLSFALNGNEGPKLQMNQQIYRVMLDNVLRRVNEKPVWIFIVGCGNEMIEIDVHTFPMHPALKISYFPVDYVRKILAIERKPCAHNYIKLTDDVLNGLRNVGLCP